MMTSLGEVPELPMEEKKLFDSRMAVRRVRDVGGEAHQHADPVALRIGCKQLAGDAGCDIFPFGFPPPEDLG
jgi:hypothetical protein